MALRRICSQEFRDALKFHFPGLKREKEELWRHLRRLIYAADYSKVPISQQHIAFDFKVIHKYASGNFKAITYIQEFKGAVYPYRVIEWDYLNHQCRYAVVTFKPEVLKLIEDELEGKLKGPRVLISNGNIVTKNTRTAFRKEDRETALLVVDKRTYHHISDKFLNYLNNVLYLRFTKMLKHIPEAMAAIEAKDETGNYIINPKSHREQRIILQCIEEQPQPFYAYTSTGNTVRLFEVNKGLQGVHSSLRKIITQDCIEVDIQNAHLAIVARLWNIPEIQEYLSKGESIWATLIPAMGFPYPNPRIKAELKEFFYGLIYGMGKKKLRKGMIDAFGKEAYNLFINHPLIKALLAAREKRMDVIKSQKEYLTPLGVVTHPFQYWDKEKRELKSNIPTILSQEATEIEMLLLEPILDYAIESKTFTIVLYQFDGLSLQFEHKKRSKNILLKLKELVEERAKSLGVITTLTY